MTISSGTYYIDINDGGGAGTGRDADAYASMSSFEADIVNLTGAMTVHCAGSTADTTGVTFDGWSDTASNFLTVQGDEAATDSDGIYEGTDHYSTSHYRIAPSSGSGIYITSVDYLRIKGIQFVVNLTGQYTAGCRINGQASANFERCRFVDLNSGGTINTYGIWYQANQSAATVDTCSVVGFKRGILMAFQEYGTTDGAVYNCLVAYSAEYGMRFEYPGSLGYHNLFVKNNIGHSNNSDDYQISWTSGTVTTDTNAFESYNESTTNEIDLSSVTADSIWTTPGETAASDFTIESSGILNPATNAGINVGILIDLTGTTKATPFTVGPYHFTAAGGLSIPISAYHYNHNVGSNL